MPITASFTVSQGASPASLTIKNTTVTGAEVITNRTLTILDSKGDALNGYANPIAFGLITYPTGEITLTGFTTDKALSIQMNLTASPVVVGSVYVAQQDIAMNRYLQDGLYNIQVARFLDNDLPKLAGAKAQLNSIDIIVEKQNSQTAVLYGSLVGAQNALDRGQIVVNNQIL